MIPTYDQSADLLLIILKDLGISIQKDHSILDFGCGYGNLLEAFVQKGLNAKGVDIKAYWLEGNVNIHERMGVIDVENYRFPYDDNSFDMVCSTSVFEHVQGYKKSLREIYRVLKPGGVSIHLFPGPWIMPVEPHIFVPLASMIQSKNWFNFWAFVGIRNSFQKNKGWKEVARLNYEYSQTGIHYEPRSKVKEMVLDIFGNIRYPSKEYLKHSPGGAARLGRRISKYFPIPFYDKLLFSLREQVIYSVK